MKDRNKKEEKKLAVIVPYRNRESHLNVFVPYLEDYLKSKNIPFEILVVEQKYNKPFNRGKLLNVGYKESGNDFDYFCFHDVDMLPIKVDYSYCEIFLLLRYFACS